MEFDTKRRMTGYNLYMREQMTILKPAHPKPLERQTLVAKQWKALSQAEKDVYNAKAKGVETRCKLCEEIEEMEPEDL